MTVVTTANGLKRKPTKTKKPKVQECSDAQLKKDQKLGYGKMMNKGLEALERKQLNKVAKKHSVKVFGKTNKQVIEELRELADKL